MQAPAAVHVAVPCEAAPGDWTLRGAWPVSLARTLKPTAWPARVATSSSLAEIALLAVEATTVTLTVAGAVVLPSLTV